MFTYSPGSVSVSISGLYELEGLAAGSFLTITKDIISTDDSVAMDGEVSRVIRKDNRYTVKVSLAQSSPSNNVLNALYNIDKELGVGKFPIYISEGTGTSSFLAMEAWVEELPDLSMSDNVETREWVIKCSSGVLNVGGNGSKLDIENALSSIASVLPLLKQYGVI